jgi:hypothetical protein
LKLPIPKEAYQKIGSHDHQIAAKLLTPKCVPAGTKNSQKEDFLLAKHTSHKHPHHDKPFSLLAAWF